MSANSENQDTDGGNQSHTVIPSDVVPLLYIRTPSGGSVKVGRPATSASVWPISNLIRPMVSSTEKPCLTLNSQNLATAQLRGSNNYTFRFQQQSGNTKTFPLVTQTSNIGNQPTVIPVSNTVTGSNNSNYSNVGTTVQTSESVDLLNEDGPLLLKSLTGMSQNITTTTNDQPQNVFVPVSIPTSSSKSGVINFKIANNQIQTNSSGATVLSEPKLTLLNQKATVKKAIALSQPPPLALSTSALKNARLITDINGQQYITLRSSEGDVNKVFQLTTKNAQFGINKKVTVKPVVANNGIRFAVTADTLMNRKSSAKNLATRRLVPLLPKESTQSEENHNKPMQSEINIEPKTVEELNNDQPNSTKQPGYNGKIIFQPSVRNHVVPGKTNKTVSVQPLKKNLTIQSRIANIQQCDGTFKILPFPLPQLKKNQVYSLQPSFSNQYLSDYTSKTKTDDVVPHRPIDDVNEISLSYNLLLEKAVSDGILLNDVSNEISQLMDIENSPHEEAVNSRRSLLQSSDCSDVSVEAAVESHLVNTSKNTDISAELLVSHEVDVDSSEIVAGHEMGVDNPDTSKFALEIVKHETNVENSNNSKISPENLIKHDTLMDIAENNSISTAENITQHEMLIDTAETSISSIETAALSEFLLDSTVNNVKTKISDILDFDFNDLTDIEASLDSGISEETTFSSQTSTDTVISCLTSLDTLPSSQTSEEIVISSQSSEDDQITEETLIGSETCEDGLVSNIFKVPVSIQKSVETSEDSVESTEIPLDIEKVEKCTKMISEISVNNSINKGTSIDFKKNYEMCVDTIVNIDDISTNPAADNEKSDNTCKEIVKKDVFVDFTGNDEDDEETFANTSESIKTFGGAMSFEQFEEMINNEMIDEIVNMSVTGEMSEVMKSALINDVHKVTKNEKVMKIDENGKKVKVRKKIWKCVNDETDRTAVNAETIKNAVLEELDENLDYDNISKNVIEIRENDNVIEISDDENVIEISDDENVIEISEDKNGTEISKDVAKTNEMSLDTVETRTSTDNTIRSQTPHPQSNVNYESLVQVENNVQVPIAPQTVDESDILFDLVTNDQEKCSQTITCNAEFLVKENSAIICDNSVVTAISNEDFSVNDSVSSSDSIVLITASDDIGVESKQSDKPKTGIKRPFSDLSDSSENSTILTSGSGGMAAKYMKTLPTMAKRDSNISVKKPHTEVMKELPKQNSEGNVANVEDEIMLSIEENDDFDPIKFLDWKDGIGYLPGSNLKFRVNEFGLIEMVEDEDYLKIVSDTSSGVDIHKEILDTNITDIVKIKEEPEEFVVLEEEEPDQSIAMEEEDQDQYLTIKTELEDYVDESMEEDKKMVPESTAKPAHASGLNKGKVNIETLEKPDEILCCNICGCYGLLSEFYNSCFCSEKCSSMVTVKNEVENNEDGPGKENQRNKYVKKTRLKNDNYLQQMIFQDDDNQKELKLKRETNLQQLRLKKRKKRLFQLMQIQFEQHKATMNAVKTISKKVEELFLKKAKKAPSISASLKKAPSISASLKKAPSISASLKTAPSICASLKKSPSICASLKKSPSIRASLKKAPSICASLKKSVHVPAISICSRKSTPSPVLREDDSSNLTSSDQSQVDENKLPCQLGKIGYFWPKYLEQLKAEPAPKKLFRVPYPFYKNGFKVGMKMEGIDPKCPKHFCVLTVAEVQGFRIKLHFDEYSDVHDFWVNADCEDIFPAGWCEKNNRKLQPPIGYTSETFCWEKYLKQCNAIAAPKNLFIYKPNSSLRLNSFFVGMKLEAMSIQMRSMMCVATVADSLDNRILVHLDGWGDAYDYWTDVFSPYIHPPGWCHKNGKKLYPPKGMNPDTFSWKTYLDDTNSVAAPASAFIQHLSANRFQAGTKLECVDPRTPSLIRVATIIEVKNNRLKISFDGWPAKYNVWVEEDSSDIHPVGWCYKTGHYLEQPPVSEDREMSTDIVKSEQLFDIKPTADYLNTLVNAKNFSTSDAIMEYEESLYRLKLETDKAIKKPLHLRPVNSIPTKELRESGALSETSGIRNHKKEMDLENKLKRRQAYLNNRDNSPVNKEGSVNPERLAHELKKSIYSKSDVKPNDSKSHLWTKHTIYLHKEMVHSEICGDPITWTAFDVSSYVESIPGCRDVAEKFDIEAVDGEAFLTMNQNDIIDILGCKLGPALKIYNSILLLRREFKRS